MRTNTEIVLKSLLDAIEKRRVWVVFRGPNKLEMKVVAVYLDQSLANKYAETLCREGWVAWSESVEFCSYVQATQELDESR